MTTWKEEIRLLKRRIVFVVHFEDDLMKSFVVVTGGAVIEVFPSLRERLRETSYQTNRKSERLIGPKYTLKQSAVTSYMHRL